MKYSSLINKRANLKLLSLVIVFCSCNKVPQTNLSVYRMFAASFNNTRHTIELHNISLLQSLEKKTADPVTADKASYWFPKARLIQEKTNEIIVHIDSLKYKLEVAAGLTTVNGKNRFREDDFEVVSKLFDNDGEGEELKKIILNFENDVMAIDPGMSFTFKNQTPLFLRMDDPSENGKKTFTETFFGNIPVVGALAMLDKFQNDIVVFENQLIGFCHDKVPL